MGRAGAAALCGRNKPGVRRRQLRFRLHQASAAHAASAGPAHLLHCHGSRRDLHAFVVCLHLHKHTSRLQQCHGFNGDLRLRGGMAVPTCGSHPGAWRRVRAAVAGRCALDGSCGTGVFAARRRRLHPDFLLFARPRCISASLACTIILSKNHAHPCLGGPQKSPRQPASAGRQYHPQPCMHALACQCGAALAQRRQRSRRHHLEDARGACTGQCDKRAALQWPGAVPVG